MGEYLSIRMMVHSGQVLVQFDDGAQGISACSLTRSWYTVGECLSSHQVTVGKWLINQRVMVHRGCVLVQTSAESAQWVNACSNVG